MGEWFTCVSVPSYIHLVISIMKISLLCSSLASPLTKQDDTCSARDPVKIRAGVSHEGNRCDSKITIRNHKHAKGKDEMSRCFKGSLEELSDERQRVSHQRR